MVSASDNKRRDESESKKNTSAKIPWASWL